MASLTKYPEPPDSEKHRKRGETTLKQCGWCEFAGGTHRYDYCIEGNCSLQRDYSDEIHWDDKCLFLDASQNEIKSCIDYHFYKIKEAEKSIERHNKYIYKLKELHGSAKYTPQLPENREYNHFNEGDRIALYFESKWLFGEVVAGYRHHDGCVSYKLDNFGPQQNGFWGCGVAIPHVMLESEYVWFKSHPKEYELWCKKAYNKKCNGKILEVAKI